MTTSTYAILLSQSPSNSNWQVQGIHNLTDIDMLRLETKLSDQRPSMSSTSVLRLLEMKRQNYHGVANIWLTEVDDSADSKLLELAESDVSQLLHVLNQRMRDKWRIKMSSSLRMEACLLQMQKHLRPINIF